MTQTVESPVRSLQLLVGPQRAQNGVCSPERTQASLTSREGGLEMEVKS